MKTRALHPYMTEGPHGRPRPITLCADLHVPSTTWLTLGHAALLVVAGAVLGCDRPLAQGEPPLCGEACSWSLSHHFTREVDLLLVIDNSGSTADETGPLRFQTSALFAPLRQAPHGLPDLHVGVTSTDLGAGPYGITFCEEEGGDNGNLLTGACPNPFGVPYIVDVEPRSCAIAKDDQGICSGHDCRAAHCGHEPSTTLTVDESTGCPRCRNYSNQEVEDAFSCIAGLGTQGCGFEQTLEAMRLALDPANVHNQGFVRENAILAVLIITDEDDCSASDTSVYDPSQTGAESPLGPLTSFRCFEFGVSCDVNGREPGLRSGCVPREDEGAMLHPVSRYIELLEELKEPRRLVLAAIAGPVVDRQVTVGLDEYDQPEVKTSCSTERGGAVPGIRLRALVEAFARPEDLAWAYGSYCAPTYTDSLMGFSEGIVSRTQAPCPPWPLGGCTDPGAEHGLAGDDNPANDQCLAYCEVVDILQAGLPEESRHDVPPCLEVCVDGPCPFNTDRAWAYASGHPTALDPSLPVPACWHVEHATRCQAAKYALVQVSRRSPSPARSYSEVSCAPVLLTETGMCHDGLDNDGDGLADLHDPDCQ